MIVDRLPDTGNHASWLNSSPQHSLESRHEETLSNPIDDNLFITRSTSPLPTSKPKVAELAVSAVLLLILVLGNLAHNNIFEPKISSQPETVINSK